MSRRELQAGLDCSAGRAFLCLLRGVLGLRAAPPKAGACFRPLAARSLLSLSPSAHSASARQEAGSALRMRWCCGSRRSGPSPGSDNAADCAQADLTSQRLRHVASRPALELALRTGEAVPPPGAGVRPGRAAKLPVLPRVLRTGVGCPLLVLPEGPRPGPKAFFHTGRGSGDTPCFSPGQFLCCSRGPGWSERARSLQPRRERRPRPGLGTHSGLAELSRAPGSARRHRLRPEATGCCCAGRGSGSGASPRARRHPRGLSPRLLAACLAGREYQPRARGLGRGPGCQNSLWEAGLCPGAALALQASGSESLAQEAAKARPKPQAAWHAHRPRSLPKLAERHHPCHPQMGTA